MYAVVQFPDVEGGTVAIVNHDWLTPRKCEVYWPPIKGTKEFEKLLNKQTSPDDKWHLYSVQRILYETDSLDKAKKKVKLAEVTSDLATEDENEKTQDLRPRRRTHPTRRYLDSSEDEDLNDHIRPPPLKKQFLPYIKQNQTSTNGCVMPSCSTPSNIDTIADNTSLFHTKDLPENLEFILVTPDKSLPTLSDSVLNTNLESACLTAQVDCQPKKLADSKQACAQVNDDTQPQQVLTGFEEIVVSLLSKITTQNDLILSLMKKNNVKHTLKPDLKFPSKTLDELNANEKLLLVQENYENLVSYISTLGGTDTSSKVTRAMKLLMSDCLAKDFNFYGKRSNKKPFCQLRLRDCIVDGVKISSPSSVTEKNVEDSIKIWLKHAPERLKNKLIKESSNIL